MKDLLDVCGQPGCGYVIRANTYMQHAQVCYFVDANTCVKRLGFTLTYLARTVKMLITQCSQAVAEYDV